MLLNYLFCEFSPILIPLDFLPEVSQFFLDKDLSFWIAFIVLSVIVFLQVQKDYQILISKKSKGKGTNLSFLNVLFFIVLSGFQYHEIAYCDGVNALSPPPSPVQLPEEPVTPPEAPPVPQPVPQPVVIPQLAQPLISDDTRRSLLYHRYLVLNFGGDDDLQRMVSIIDAQVIVERYVEAALVDDGFRPHSVLSKYGLIRGALHSPQGELLSARTYNSYVTQIREDGTRQSVPYRRIMRAIQNYYVLLER